MSSFFLPNTDRYLLNLDFEIVAVISKSHDVQEENSNQSIYKQVPIIKPFLTFDAWKIILPGTEQGTYSSGLKIKYEQLLCFLTFSKGSQNERSQSK